MPAFSYYVTLFIIRELQFAVKTFCSRQDTRLTSAPNSGLWTVCLTLLDCQNRRVAVTHSARYKSNRHCSTIRVEISSHGTAKNTEAGNETKVQVKNFYLPV